MMTALRCDSDLKRESESKGAHLYTSIGTSAERLNLFEIWALVSNGKPQRERNPVGGSHYCLLPGSFVKAAAFE